MIVDYFKLGLAPPTAFYFTVTFGGLLSLESEFKEVSGLKSSLDLDRRKQGGENNFDYAFPNPIKYDNLVLKRCLTPNAFLNRWCEDAFYKLKFDPVDLQISLLTPKFIKVLASWTVVQAIPVSWELGALDSTSNSLAIETLTLKYQYFKRIL